MFLFLKKQMRTPIRRKIPGPGSPLFLMAEIRFIIDRAQKGQYVTSITYRLLGFAQKSIILVHIKLFNLIISVYLSFGKMYDLSFFPKESRMKMYGNFRLPWGFLFYSGIFKT
jgi:hypothetical protein